MYVTDSPDPINLNAHFNKYHASVWELWGSLTHGIRVELGVPRASVQL